jgi:hypothetical protein
MKTALRFLGSLSRLICPFARLPGWDFDMNFCRMNLMKPGPPGNIDRATPFSSPSYSCPTADRSNSGFHRG